MPEECKSCEEDSCEVEGTLVDFVTGEKVPDTLAERIRQKTERFLVENKGYSKDDIEVGKEFETDVGSETIKSKADLIIRLGGKGIMVIKCIYGALMTGERLVLSYARLLEPYQIPFAVVTNGENTNVFGTVSGQVLDGGPEAIPSKDDLNIEEIEFIKFPEDKIEMEKRVLAAFELIDEAMCPTA